MLVPHLNTIIGTVDRIHIETGYRGSRLSLSGLSEFYPGLVFQELPEGVAGAGVAFRRRGISILPYPTGPLALQRVEVARALGSAILHENHLPGLGLPSIPQAEETLAQQRDRFAIILLAPLWALPRALPDSVLLGDELIAIAAIRLRWGVTAEVAQDRLAAYRSNHPLTP